MTDANNFDQTVDTPDVAGYGKHYSEAGFWQKVKALPRSTVGAILEKALLCRELLLDGNTPFWVKGTLLGSLGYLILPLDLVPDFIPGAGFVDDIALLGMVLANLDHLVTDDIRRRVQQRLPADLRKLPAETANDRQDQKLV